ncbi:MAG: nucleotidyl transferase [Phycisphaerales bacterium]|nr:nucleotidyl transferase [Phycisphaerales bacterium]
MQSTECRVRKESGGSEISNFKFEISNIPVALLAGGLATRLRPITQAIPKALVDVGGRPFIDHQLSLLARHGVRDVVLCLGHLGAQVEEYVGDGSSHGLNVRYSYDGETLVGTAGALRWALPMLGDVFWVMYGDSYMDIDYPAVLKHFEAACSLPGDFGAGPCRPGRSEAPHRAFGPTGATHPGSENSPSISERAVHYPLGLMTVLRNDDRWDRSNVVFENGRLETYDKRNRTPAMRYIDYGVQLLRREALLHIAPGEPADLADVYRDLAASGRMVGYEVSNRFYEIGTPESLEETRRALSSAGDPPAQARKSA